MLAYQSRRVIRFGYALLFAFGLTFAWDRCQATDLEKETSLPLAPRNADFYYSSLRNREDWEKLVNSAVSRDLQSIPVVKSFIEKVKADWNANEGNAKELKAYIENPNINALLMMLGDMFSNEVFVFGDGEFSEAMAQFYEVQRSFLEYVSSQDFARPDQWFMQTDPKLFEIPVPTVVMGFEVKDKERVLTHLDQLEGIIRFGAMAEARLQTVTQQLKRVEDRRGTRLVLRLSGDMVPWEELAAGVDPESSAAFKRLREVVSKMHFTLTVGLLDRYAVFAVSDAADDIVKLGQAESLLTHADMQLLKQHASETLTSIVYTSDRLADVAYQNQLRHLFENYYYQFAVELRKGGDEVPRMLQTLKTDLKWLDDQFATLVPPQKGLLAVGYSTSTGSEGYVYERTIPKRSEPAQPLSILSHITAQPLAFSVGRNGLTNDHLAVMRRILQKVRGYLADIKDNEEFDGNVREFTGWALSDAYPLAMEFIDTVDRNILPGIRNSEFGVVLAQSTIESKQFVPMMPPSDTPLKLVELGFVGSVTNREQLIAGLANIHQLSNTVIQRVAAKFPEASDKDLLIPTPEHSETTGGERFRFVLPEELGIPKSVAPQMVFKGTWASVTVSDSFSEQLLRNSTLDSKFGAMFDARRPMTAASYVHFGGIVKAVTPWVRYGLLNGFQDLNAVVFPAENNLPSVTGNDILQIWAAFEKIGSFSSTSERMANGGRKTHWRFTSE